MSPLVNITDTPGPCFAWQGAKSGCESLWWETLRADPIFAPRWHRVKVHPNGCWFLQMAACNQAGHILLSAGKTGQRVYAHRHAYALAFGKPPAVRVVRHQCDDPACINPSHLLLGSQRANVYDAIARDRRNAFGRQRLTVAKVVEIRRRFAAGDTQRAIARAFDVSKGCIHAVVHRLTWTRGHRALKATAPQAEQPNSHAHIPNQEGDVCLHARESAPRRLAAERQR